MAKRKWRPEIERDRSMRAYEMNPRARGESPRCSIGQLRLDGKELVAIHPSAGCQIEEWADARP